ncbi:MAG: nucleotidyltransferase family protein [Oscillospiraceae bacterium]|nr:nucleotidyltransferase family protein [Oscillospiraceae bacterium]
MKTVGIICEYNPFHLGHAGHIERTKFALGGDVAVVCVMSGNFVQRGDFAILNKHARAEMAINSGADLVIELPVSYSLQSAEGFAQAGVHILDQLGVCEYLSFGSESGDINMLCDCVDAITSEAAQYLIKEWLDKGVSYATAQQKTADEILGEKARIFNTPNNVLGIEYIKAIKNIDSKIQPFTVTRTGGEHDSDSGYSGSGLRKTFINGDVPSNLMTEAATAICKEELSAGRGPVSFQKAELAILSRLRMRESYEDVPGISEGLESRFLKFASTEYSVTKILEKVKTKRYTMARLRRILMCAVLNIKKQDIEAAPPYARILAANNKGIMILGKARKKTKMPILTKPASVYKLNKSAILTFELEAAATDFYTLAYPNEEERTGGQEWRKSPVIIRG